MLYRVLLGMIPTVLIALVVTGAIPMPGMSGTYQSTAASAANTAEAVASSAAAPEVERLGPVRNGQEAVAEGIGRIYGVRPDQDRLMREEISEMEKNMEAAAQRSERRSTGWEAKSAGWGSSAN